VTGPVAGECGRCGHIAFPRLLLCPRCGAAEWRERRLCSGTVEEVTLVRRMPGSEPAEPVPVGSVRAEGGPVFVARLEAGVGSGDRVELVDDGGAPVARIAQTTLR
jgi:uncharacterized OB-fold protein